MPRTSCLYCSVVTSLLRVQSLPATKSTETVWRGSPALVHFDLLPRTTHLLAQRSLQRVKSLPATKSTEIALAGIPRASSFRVTSKKHPPACSVVVATPSPATIDVAASRWLCCRCVVSFLQRNKPKLSGTYLQLLGLHSTKC